MLLYGANGASLAEEFDILDVSAQIEHILAERELA